MDIIFAKLPRYLDPVSLLIQKLGYRVFYLELIGSPGETEETEKRRVAKLNDADIVPLPLENLSHFRGFSEIYYDPEMKAFKISQKIAPIEFLQIFEKLYPNTTHITKKLQIAIHSMVANHMTVTGKVNIWAAAYPDRNYLLIDLSPLALITTEPAPNVRQLVLPLDVLDAGVATVINVFYRSLGLLKHPFRFKNKAACREETHSREVIPSRIALVTHKGLDYGPLFQKDLFYSNRPDSDLHPERLLHIDYSGWTSPSEKLNWVCLGNHRQSWISNLSSALVAMSKGILHIRHLRHILGLLLLTRSYVIFRSFSTKLETYPDLKMALIDYEILCPKELLLAFESKGIQTVATQERFILTYNNLFGSTILSYYLCGSSYCADTMKLSPLYSVEHFFPVGQYRSDNLLNIKKSPLPQVLKDPRAKCIRIITALGFHTAMKWQNSQTTPLLNWKSHQHFLGDMIRLSEEIPGIFIILRYKDTEWMSLPIFAETVQKIKSSDNITISTNYETFNISYDLCAHSDLVIAKHTSLADECLSVGIPVLFHEYTHNTERLIADAFDYSPARIMCFNYQELKDRVQIILSGTPNAMTDDYEYLKNVIYGGLGDGRVKERIHVHIEELLSEM